MEIVGAVAAVPGILEIIVKTVMLVQDCASSARFSKATKGLDVQLELLRDILVEIERGWKARSPPRSDFKKLNGAFKELREELDALNELLGRALASSLARRIKMSLFGFEKKLKEHLMRIEQIKSLLTLKMTTGIHANMPGMSTSHFIARKLSDKAR